MNTRSYDESKANISDAVPEFQNIGKPPSDNRYYPPASQGNGNESPGFMGQLEETTVISKNTVIIGNIKSLASVKIDGNVRGKVEVLKDASVNGMLVGDLTCNNAEMQGSSIQGNVLSKGNTYVDNSTIILGDVAAQYAAIDGKIKGNIEVGSKVEFRENAIVAGDIYTNTISVADGANIRGYVSTSYFQEHGDDVFPNKLIIEEE
jgi:cytoskeletal protein CcmA (bactofilin family)